MVWCVHVTSRAEEEFDARAERYADLATYSYIYLHTPGGVRKPDRHINRYCGRTIPYVSIGPQRRWSVSRSVARVSAARAHPVRGDDTDRSGKTATRARTYTAQRNPISIDLLTGGSVAVYHNITIYPATVFQFFHPPSHRYRLLYQYDIFFFYRHIHTYMVGRSA